VKFDRLFQRSTFGYVPLPGIEGEGVDWSDLDFLPGFDSSGTANGGNGAPARRRLGLWPSPAYSPTCNDVVAGAFYDRALRGGFGKALRVRPHGTKVWEKDLFPQTTSAMGRGGRRYVVRDSGLEAYDQAGKRLWRTDRSGTPVALALGRPKTIRDNRTGATPLNLGCLREEQDGRQITVREQRNEVETIYVSRVAGDVQAFSGVDGRLLWSRDLGDDIPGAPAVAQTAGGDVIFVTSGSRAARRWWLTALRGNGTVLWRTALDSPAGGTPAIAGDVVYVATERSLYAIR
jgi:outer membrane protein assembly factor BamB